MAEQKYPAFQIIKDKKIYRCDESRIYNDGGYEVNVRGPFPLGCYKEDGSLVHQWGQVTCFYVDKFGRCRETDDKRSPSGKRDTPRDEWLDWEPFAKLYCEAKKMEWRLANE